MLRTTADRSNAQHALVLGGLQASDHRPACFAYSLDQRDLRVLAAGQAQVVDGLRVDGEHRRGGAVLRRHVGDGRAVAERQRRRRPRRRTRGRRRRPSGWRRNSVSASTMSVAVMPGCGWPASSTPTMSGSRIHDARPSITLSASRPPTPIAITPSASTCGVWLSVPTSVSGNATPSLRVDHRRHPLQVDLMHDPVARRDHLDVLEGALRPLDEVEAVLVAPILDRAVLRERVRVEAAALHRQRMVDDQLHRHHRVDLRRIAALLGDRVAQAGQVDQRGLAEDVVADHARREPREVEVAPALDQLRAGIASSIAGIAAAHQVLGMHARGVGQRRSQAPGAIVLDGGAGVEVVERGAGQVFAVSSVHAWTKRLSGGPRSAGTARSSGPV